MQDAFTKTIPIWCSVLNTATQEQRQKTHSEHEDVVHATAVHYSSSACNRQHAAGSRSKPTDHTSSEQRATQHDGLQHPACSNTSCTDPEPTPTESLDFSTPLWKLPSREGSHTSAEAAQHPSSHPRAAWDTSLHVPPWITHTEHSLIVPQISSWALDLLATCQHSLPECVLSLEKPLRPLWLSQNSSIWTNHVAPVHSLPFTPLYLVSASLPLLYHRKVTRIPRDISSCEGDTVEEQDNEEEENLPACQDTNETVSYVYVSLSLVMCSWLLNDC